MSWLEQVETEAGFLRSWAAWVTLGESVGFLAPALTQFGITALGITALAPAATMPALVASGLVEGAVLGWAQSQVLRRRIPALSMRNWILLTAAAAALAWFIGLLAGTWPELWQAWPVPAQVIAGAAAAVVLLCSIGAAQWVELRRHRTRAGWWVAGSAAAWFAGLSVFFGVAMPLWEPGQQPGLVILIGVLAGILMAVTMAVVTGLVLLRVLRAPSVPPARYGAV